MFQTILRILYQNARTSFFARNLKIKVKTLFLIMERLPYNNKNNFYSFLSTNNP